MAFKNLTTETTVSLEDERLLDWLGITENRNMMQEITYYTCMKLLSETLGKMPFKFYRQTEHGRIRAEPTEVTKLLTIRPNELMTPTTMWTTVEYNCEHYGNAYVWIRGSFMSKYQYKIHDLWPVCSKDVDVLMDDAGIFGGKGKLYYKYTDPRTTEIYIWKSSEVMHFKTWCSADGILGKSVRNILEDTISGASESQKVMNNLYKQGLTASMAMQYTGDLDEAQRKKLSAKFADILCGPKSAGKVIPVPVGLQLTPLKMTMADAQFLELKKFSALQIAGAFGLKPNQINDYEKSSYANSETQQLDFLVGTISYRLKMYEEEINYKLLTPKEEEEGYFYRFNEKALLRTDSKTQMEVLRAGVQNGLYTINQGKEYLGLPTVPEGDVTMVNGNLIPLAMVGQQWMKGGNGNEDNQS